MMRGDQPLTLTDADLTKLPAEWKSKMKGEGDAFYLGADPAVPVVGDQRVTFTFLKPAAFSILARKSGQTLNAYPTQSERAIQRVESGDISVGECS